MLRPLPPETFWTVTCIGRHHHRMLGAGAAAGARPASAPASRTSPTSAKGVLAPSNAALVEMAVGLAAHPRPRGRDARSRRRSCWSLADDGRRTRPPAPCRRPRARHARRRSRPPPSSCSPGSATTRPRCGRSPPRRGIQPAAIYHWYPSKEAILVGLQDDFMERLDRARRGRDRAPGPRPRCSSPPPSASTSSSTACTRRRRSSPTARSARSTDGPRARADRPARRLPGAASAR